MAHRPVSLLAPRGSVAADDLGIDPGLDARPVGFHPLAADLEQLFFSLTEGTNRNLGAAGDPAAPAMADAIEPALVELEIAAGLK